MAWDPSYFVDTVEWIGSVMADISFSPSGYDNRVIGTAGHIMKNEVIENVGIEKFSV